MVKNKIRIQKDESSFFDITVAPNQKVVTTKKVKKYNYILDMKSNRAAMAELKPAAYMLYMHFILNKSGYVEALSLTYITQHTTLSERAYYAAINELINKGYLKKDSDSSFDNYYIFRENKKDDCGEAPEVTESV